MAGNPLSPGSAPTSKRDVERRLLDARSTLEVGVGSSDGITFVAIAGDVDVATEPVLAAALAAYRVGRVRTLILDLQDVNYIAARGVSIVVDAARRASAQGVRIRVVPSRAVRRVATLLGLADELWPECMSQLVRCAESSCKHLQPLRLREYPNHDV